MRESYNAQSLPGASSLELPKRSLLEVIIFSYGSFVLGVKIPLYIIGLIGVFTKIDFALIKDQPQILALAPVGVLFLFKNGGWGMAGLVVWLLLALGSVIYLMFYFPQDGQRPWQRCLAFMVRACGGGAAAFGITLNLWALLKMPGNEEHNLFSREAVIVAFIIGSFCALLTAYWPAWRKGRVGSQRSES